MIDAAHARLGSLEMLAALVAVAVIAARPRVRDPQEAGVPSPVAVTLKVYEFGEERTVETTAPLTIGRDSTVQLVLKDPEASRRHVRLETRDGVVYVRDLESSNGTFLNGRKVDNTIEMREGDEIDVGTTRIIVERLRPWT